MTAPVVHRSLDVVVPSVGRPSVRSTLASLAAAGCRAEQIVVVDDGGRSGPAAARNRGVAATTGEWIVFLDDDVEVTPDWQEALDRDLANAAPDVAAVQGRIVVPLPAHRRPTDAERDTARLEDARWITADLAVRRTAIESIGGFDERFRRAYREDSDLALRLAAAGWRITTGERCTIHPVRSDGVMRSVRAQAGNADDALLIAIHGRDVRARLGEPPSILWRHALTTLAGVVGLVSAATGRTRGARVGGLVWVALTGWFAGRRIVRGPRTATEVSTMIVTSVVIPPLACWHRLRGEWTVHRGGAR